MLLINPLDNIIFQEDMVNDFLKMFLVSRRQVILNEPSEATKQPISIITHDWAMIMKSLHSDLFIRMKYENETEEVLYWILIPLMEGIYY